MKSDGERSREKDMEIDGGRNEDSGRARERSPEARKSPPQSPPRRRNFHQRHREEDSEDEEERRAKLENQKWVRRRDDRMDILRHGENRIWGRSPTQRDIEMVYILHEEAEKKKEAEEEKGKKLKQAREAERKKEDKKRKSELLTKKAVPSSSDSSPSDSESSSSEEDRKKKKKRKKERKEKKSKKHKKDKKKKKKKKRADSGKDSGGEDEWVEVTAQMRAQQAKEEEDLPGPAIPEHLLKGPQAAAAAASNIKANYGKDMLRGEAANMAAYVARGERIPRRGEIGLSSAEIQEYEKVGYVMSGTRHKAMEATRLRKENQILTAEEKRMLSGFSHTERKKKEEAVLNQFKSLINSTKAKD
ncbi:hypothetical protein WR25_15084 [Diploscapter pachys]|uniref:NF-kappa-B-activating protein C-terminal domain-containing protein n=1 Tax=Diploscapter pachys TaxID=2018661 RepID=A0A2A2LLU7_9BILA|nr:hypothetical protein WR25_15084 [Diploscapter pachys]